MVQTLHPGVYTLEIDAQPKVTGVGATTGGFIGFAERGPVNKAILCTSVSQFETIFGTYYKFAGSTQTYLAFAVNGFFKSGGTACWIVRIEGSTPATASSELNAIVDSSTDQATVSALSSGAWYNKVYINNRKASASTTTALAASGGTPVSVLQLGTGEASQFEAGDIVVLAVTAGSGTLSTAAAFAVASQVQAILSVDTSLDTITLARGITSADASTITGMSVSSGTTHRKTIIGFLNTTVSVSTGSTYIDVLPGAANGLVEGQQLLIAGTVDGAAVAPTATGNTTGAQGICMVTVDYVQQESTYDRINFKSSVTLSGLANRIKDGATVRAVIASLETTVNVYYAGELLETHAFLSYHASNKRDFIGSSSVNGRLLGTATNESNYITITVQAAVANNTPALFFWTAGVQAINAIGGGTDTSGSDGTIPSTASTVVTTTALEVFKDAIDLSMLACPDIAVLADATKQSDACKRLSDFTVEHPDVMVFLGPPNAATHITGTSSVQNMSSWRNTLPIDSNRTALFWPYLVVEDPTVSTSPSVSSTAFSFGFGKSTLNVPPEGHVMGQCAKITASRGPHVAPANLPHVGVYDVSYHCNDADQDLLNPKGVNAIRAFPAQGVRTWGCRTLWSITDGRHYIPVVRLLQFIERSIREGNRFAVFQPNDPLLWAQVTAANKSFLSSIWQQGMLFPSNDESQAYFVKCDSDTNPPSERAAGRLNCLIGVNPPKPAEFVIFKVGIFDGASEIEEIIQGANAAGFFVG